MRARVDAMNVACGMAKFLESSGSCALACLALFATFAMSGCAGDLPSHRGTDVQAGCTSPHFEVLQAISEDSATRRNSGFNFDQPEVVVLWGKMPATADACGFVRGRVKLIRSASGTDRDRSIIAIEKLYYDEDAAFIGVWFPPTGMNGDFFLRRKAGRWQVVESELWEN